MLPAAVNASSHSPQRPVEAAPVLVGAYRTHQQITGRGNTAYMSAARTFVARWPQVRDWESEPLDVQLAANTQTRPFITFLLVTGRLHAGSVCETSDGLPLPPASVARLLCEGRISPIIVDTNGIVLAVGRELRHANRHQRRALRAMYRTCAFHGCDTPFDRCEIHHIDPWERGGPTDLDNLIPLCSRHHHVVHEGGWRLDLTPDRTLTITRPAGVVHATTRPDIATERQQRRRQPAA